MNSRIGQALGKKTRGSWQGWEEPSAEHDYGRFVDILQRASIWLCFKLPPLPNPTVRTAGGPPNYTKTCFRLKRHVVCYYFSQYVSEKGKYIQGYLYLNLRGKNNMAA